MKEKEVPLGVEIFGGCPAFHRLAADGGFLMRGGIAMALLAWTSLCQAADPPIPLQSGTYEFQWKDAEFSSSPGFPVKVVIDGNKISVVNEHVGGAAPLGELESAQLMWNAKVGKWVLGYSEADKVAPDPGGCSGEGPHAIDFKARVIWTCEWGP